jgi:hypothetical protein
MEKTATIYRRDGSEKTVDVHEASRLVGAGAAGPGKEWSFHKPPPLNWEFTIPKYRVTRDISPPTRDRYRTEKPFTTMADNDCWQYADRPYQRGEEISTTAWPHASFQPLTHSAKMILNFFNSAMKSRLPLSPWFNGRVRLDTGLSDAPGIVDVSPPKLQQMNLRPVAQMEA